jgi:hypothetical protein
MQHAAQAATAAAAAAPAAGTGQAQGGPDKAAARALQETQKPQRAKLPAAAVGKKGAAAAGVGPAAAGTGQATGVNGTNFLPQNMALLQQLIAAGIGPAAAMGALPMLGGPFTAQQQQLPPHPEVDAAVQEQVVMGGGGNGGARVQLQLDLPAHWDYRWPMGRNSECGKLGMTMQPEVQG